VYVVGSKEGGKLGLGPSMVHGLLLNFTKIPSIYGIKFLSCGPYHMLGIQNDSEELYSWGFNDRG
jgi:alpha-tubulin suppressor-like RCC1 family protein